MNNFYTQHILKKQQCVLSDTLCRVLGTVHMDHLDCVNRPALKKAITDLKKADSGAWWFRQALDSRRTQNDSPTVVNNCNLVKLKEWSVVMYYTNRPADFLPDQSQEPSEHVLRRVHISASMPFGCEMGTCSASTSMSLL